MAKTLKADSYKLAKAMVQVITQRIALMTKMQYYKYAEITNRTTGVAKTFTIAY